MLRQTMKIIVTSWTFHIMISSKPTIDPRVLKPIVSVVLSNAAAAAGKNKPQQREVLCRNRRPLVFLVGLRRSPER